MKTSLQRQVEHCDKHKSVLVKEHNLPLIIHLLTAGSVLSLQHASLQRQVKQSHKHKSVRVKEHYLLQIIHLLTAESVLSLQHEREALCCKQYRT